jgi:hypothetical protein
LGELTLTCTVCGAPTHADTGSLRKGFTHCRSCGTIHRVAQDGLAPTHDTSDTVPDGVRVREAPNRLSLTARVATGAPSAHGRELLCGLVAALGAGYAASGHDLPWFLVPIIGLVAFFLTVALTAKLRRFPPPVVLSGSVLRSGVRLTKIPVSDVAQVYTTEFNPNFGPMGGQLDELQRQKGTHEEVYWVCALRNDATRVQLLGPIARLEHALYVEERLEAALGLANRGVRGELGHDAVRTETPQSEAIACEGCGASRAVDDQARRQGFVLCSYCRTATVLASGGSLGDALAERKPPQFEITEHDGLTITPVGGSPVLTLAGGKLRLLDATIDLADVGEPVVKLASDPNVMDILGAVGKLNQLTAYSASSAGDAAALVTDMLNLELRIEVNVGRIDTVLVDRIKDPREAFEILALLRKWRSTANASPPFPGAG